MNLKEKLMNKMMGNMSTEEKEKMMDNMMSNFFNGMSTEDKENMMSNMMGKMMGGSGKNPMMGMMGMMMGHKGHKSDNKEHSSPMDMCHKMMSGFTETANSAKFATAELRNLFDEWCQQVEQEILDAVNETKEVNIDQLKEKFNLSEESIKYILSRLANKGMINYQV